VLLLLTRLHYTNLRAYLIHKCFSFRFSSSPSLFAAAASINIVVGGDGAVADVAVRVYLCVCADLQKLRNTFVKGFVRLQ